MNLKLEITDFELEKLILTQPYIGYESGKFIGDTGTMHFGWRNLCRFIEEETVVIV